MMGNEPRCQRRLAAQFRLIVTVCVFVFLFGCQAPEPEGQQPEQADDVPRGLRVKTERAAAGYVCYSPILSDTTYLIDNNGAVVHTWRSEFSPVGGAYLLDNGHLLRPAKEPEVPVFKGGGQGGRIQEFTWDGELVWDWRYISEEYLLHHDIEPLPNGNILALVWLAKTPEEARAAGRLVERIPEAGLWPDKVIEIEPVPPNDARIVWEWHMWDHLIQNEDPGLENYGDPSAHPERIDINAGQPPSELDPKELARLQVLGYVPADAGADDVRPDFVHNNAVAYNQALDQIALSSRRFHEIWIIDHSTTTEEAAGSRGGRWGRGGDLLYRWGNPVIYGRGDESTQRLFAQHDVRWIPEGMPGAGNLMVFSNSHSGAGGDYSTVVEIAPPVDDEGRYVLVNGLFGPEEASWTYEAPDQVSFYSSFLSGAHRLPNGNTFITSGAQGRFFEVTPDGEIVWEYWDPYSGQIRRPDDPGRVRDNTYAVFRANKIAPDHPALAGRDLKPLDPQPPVAADGPKQSF